MKKLLTFSALGEGATGLALLIVPSIVGRVLLGQELTGVAVAVARVAGIALVGLAVGCWPGPAAVGMLLYSSAVAAYLAHLGLAGQAGPLLWPAVVVHVALTALLIRALAKERARKR